MRVGSLFAGVGGFDLGLERAGAKVVWQVEIDPACRSVLRRHWPDVDLREDVRDVGAHNLAPVDVVVGGFPCQDLSVAGRRAGLAGARSGLWWEFHRILAELRPAWCVIENVPGLLSSNGGRDMGTLIRSLGQLGYGYAYRVLDAQWAGVPQRRRRVFIVGHLGDWRSPAQVLLEPEGGLRDTPPGREAGAEFARDVAASLRGASGERGFHIDDESGSVARPLKAGGNDRRDASHETYVVARTLTAPQSPRYDGDTENFVVAATLNSGGNRGGFRTEPGEHVIPFDPTQITSPGNYSCPEPGDPCHPLAAGAHPPAIASVARPLRANRWGGADSHGDEGNIVAFQPQAGGQTGLAVGEQAPAQIGSQVAAVLRGFGHGWQGQHNDDAAAMGLLRRLTPRECERLQGFPDDWTLYGHDGKRMADSVRYRMMGNAVAVPVVEWIARRIMDYEARREVA